jgi:hypothetical protein
MDEVLAEAERRGIEVIAAPTLEAGGCEEGPGLRYPALHVLTGSTPRASNFPAPTMGYNCTLPAVCCIAGLDLVWIAFDRRHLEFFPASFLLVGWNILDVGGNPPNVAAGVFDAAIPFT